MAKDTTKIALAKLHKMAALNPDTTAKATEKDSISSQGSADADMRAREKHSEVKYDTLPTGDELEPTNTENSVGYQNAREAQMSEFGTNEALIGDGVQGEYLGQEENHHEMPRFPGIGGEDVIDEPVGTYKVYKRRWFGLVQLALLNIVTSWDVS
jgi:flagellar capping protein FliD